MLAAVGLLSLFSLLDASQALTMDGIIMLGGSHFAQLHSKTTLQCQYKLEDGQTVQKMGWFKEGVPVMTWTPPAPPVVGLEWRNRVEIIAPEGSLQFIEVAVNDGGPYTCTVQTEDGKQESSDPYDMAVADVPSYGFSMKGNVADCSLHFSFTSPPIYPKPTPLCGVWSTDAKYTSISADWQAVPYYNGSVAYSIDDTTFPVRGMPLQAGIRCEMSFPPSLTKGDDERIIAWQNTAYYPQVSERGCPPLEVGDNIIVQYSNHRTTCRGELTKQDPNAQLVAMISCRRGYRSMLRGGGMSKLQLRCDTMQWEPVGGVSWDEFEEMECIEGSSGTNDQYSEDLQSTPSQADYQPTAGAHTDVRLCTILFVMSLLVSLFQFKFTKLK